MRLEWNAWPSNSDLLISDRTPMGVLYEFSYMVHVKIFGVGPRYFRPVYWSRRVWWIR